MSAENWYFIAVIAITAGITVLLRAFPFLLFSGGKKCPPVINYIGNVLAPAAIAMLVIYCFCSVYRSKSFTGGGFGIPEFAGSLTVILLHRWKRNPLLSIISGTAVYMVILQMFFP
ncbi:MAG: branched-chain amino acid transporter AzlD [Lentisphaerae bacterium]|nr:branched-chain amino acid transporter AzlD [Lentisphaerota bacterium]